MGHYVELNPQTQHYLQTGTTMGLSLISLNWPLSFSACRTVFLASNRFMPFRMDRISKKKKQCASMKKPDTWCHSRNTRTAWRQLMRHPYQEGRRYVNKQAVLIQDVDKGQIVSLSDLVVIMVMSWRDFDSA